VGRNAKEREEAFAVRHTGKVVLGQERPMSTKEEGLNRKEPAAAAQNGVDKRRCDEGGSPG